MLKDARVISAMLAMSLGVVIALGSIGTQPTVSISELPSIESGMVVRIFGILTDLRVHDSGFESLVLADPESDAIVNLVCSPGVLPMPSEYSSIGDELQVIGEVSNDRIPPTVFAASDDVRLERSSAEILTLELLASHWRLFEGDEINVRGILVETSSDDECRLHGLDGSSSMALVCPNIEISHLNGKLVTLTGTFRLNPSTMAFYIEVREAHLS